VLELSLKDTMSLRRCHCGEYEKTEKEEERKKEVKTINTLRL
jgi:hypothetical protein